MWQQIELSLKPRARGFHLITTDIERAVAELSPVRRGLLNVFIKHSSASLTINENADPTVRNDMEQHFNQFVPENASYYRHTHEGSDDMPAHIKASTLGSSVSVPLTSGKMNLGMWQGIYLGEHRNYGGTRTLVLTVSGE
ncbi:secondary thiamine-phosphate synthase enzyme YjbQ [Cognaticolwellia mytili]|uniref:secondary thiamine-phosphate synthase enzyme YjbQ n=1 Tax=Cognaticolwellia mytili TaxID=1888913 RepID=UPI000A17762E|nr:secondary thiamine-phosphate synthase enzyme YjbQ [Cognaticolwellia mytili]